MSEKTVKPTVEEVIADVLDGGALKNALGFLSRGTFLR